MVKEGSRMPGLPLAKAELPACGKTMSASFIQILKHQDKFRLLFVMWQEDILRAESSASKNLV
jgi:hypothetical protein